MKTVGDTEKNTRTRHDVSVCFPTENCLYMAKYCLCSSPSWIDLSKRDNKVNERKVIRFRNIYKSAQIFNCKCYEWDCSESLFCTVIYETLDH